MILSRDYNTADNRLLKYPKALFCLLLQNIIDLIGKKLPSICHHKNLKFEIGELISNEFNLKIIECSEHGELFPIKLKNFVTKLMIHNWCTQINKIMEGIMAKWYYLKTNRTK